MLPRDVAAQIGLRSEYARRGLVLLSGPQVDPGFRGVLVVRVVNLAPKPVALAFGSPFLTLQFFRLTSPASTTYAGPYQEQSGIGPRDIEELAQAEGMTLGQVMKTLSALAQDVSELRASITRLTWTIPIIITIGIAVIGTVVAIK